MEIANHDWTNQLNFGSVCTFPDCRNQSACQCFRCLTLYCKVHFQIHSALCIYSTTQTNFDERVGQYVADAQTVQESRDYCLI